MRSNLHTIPTPSQTQQQQQQQQQSMPVNSLMSKQLKPLKGTKPLSDAIMKFPPATPTATSSFSVVPSLVSSKPSRRTTPSPPPTASKPPKSRPQYPGRLAKLEVAPSAEPTSTSATATTTSHLLRKAVIPAIAKIESVQKSHTLLQDDLLRVPVVLKYRDGTRTKLSVAGSSILVDEIRRKLVAKFGAARALQMSLFVHDCKLVGSLSSEADASAVVVGGGESKMSGAMHSPLKLNSDAYCFATARQVFGESGGLVLVE
ncbi:hypothetical protein BJ741DRAFT_596981 [Chytriomyces cf. hyalinus JEL632]|nr:hypothetical protein BJ741DRAFT_596981 [Chytriomyces cf. hyalinus JEL632]